MSEQVFAFDADGTLYTYTRSDANVWSGAMADALIRSGVQKDRTALIEEDKAAWQLNPCTLTHFSNVYGVPFEILFHRFHDNLDVPRLVYKNARLVAAINAAQQSKFMITDSASRFADKVLEHLGLDYMSVIARDHHSKFELKKVSDVPWRALLAQAAVAPAEIVVFEDRIGNLERAKRLGMKTVLFVAPHLDISYATAQAAMQHAYIDHVTPDLATFIAALNSGAKLADLPRHFPQDFPTD